MNFYDFLKQQYEYFNGECESCPCKIFRDKILGIHRAERECFCEMGCLADKYNIDYDIDTYLCRDNMIASLKIAKKHRKRLIKYSKNEFLSTYQTTV